MPAVRRTAFPEAALNWMLGDVPQRVLDLAPQRGRLARTMLDRGHQVYTVDRSRRAVQALVGRVPAAHHVVAQAESLPFSDRQFDLVSSAETLHKFAPGLAGAEIARVLRPGGRLVAVYNTRDDTVPWVRRLARILQPVDPEAMQGRYGQDSVIALIDGPYFGDAEQRNFRNWVPMDRDGLLEMVQRRPATAALDEHHRDQLLAEVGELYQTYARPPEPLMLPFQTSCWRAVVDHRALAVPTGDDSGLEIPLGF